MKIFLVIAGAVLAGILAGNIFFRPTSGGFSPAPANSAVNFEARPDVPIRLIIPSIDVSADIEAVGLDRDKNMDVPKNVYNAGWYSLGVRPGERGQAVIDGHFNTPELTPSVFWNLKSLKPNDKIIILDQNGHSYTYIVEKTESIPTADFPISKIFGPSNEARLNLITCAGDFDPLQKTYDQRTVVYSYLLN